MMNLAGHEFDERELICRAIRNLRPANKRYPEERWIAAKSAFGFGSTVARAICIELDLDPDEKLRRG